MGALVCLIHFVLFVPYVLFVALYVAKNRAMLESIARLVKVWLSQA
jgi:hypothetical protein